MEKPIPDSEETANNTQESHDIRGFFCPDNYQNMEEEDWQSWVTETLPDFKGNVSNAAILLKSTATGAKYIYEKITKRGISANSPKMVVLEKVPDNTSAVFHAQGNIFVGQNLLENMSLEAPNRLMTIDRENGERVLLTTRSDLFGISGVEECHHSMYEELKTIPKEDTGIAPLDASLAGYDAIQHEFRALLQQRAFAVDANLNPHTIDSLDERITNARAVRDRKLSTQPKN